MKSILLIVLFSLAALLAVCSPERAHSETITNAASVVYVRPFPLIFYRTNASPEVAFLAGKISSEYGLQKAQALSDNPVCCVWVEVKPSKSKPGVPYYAVQLNEDGSGIIIASSLELLEKAVDHLKKSAHNNEVGQLVVPVGRFSYFAE